MGVRFSRHLGSVQTLDPKQWTDQTASGRPSVCCPSCGTTAEIEPPSHVVNKYGEVTPAWSCPSETCGFKDWLDLEAYGEEVLR